MEHNLDRVLILLISAVNQLQRHPLPARVLADLVHIVVIMEIIILLLAGAICNVVSHTTTVANIAETATHRVDFVGQAHLVAHAKAEHIMQEGLVEAELCAASPILLHALRLKEFARMEVAQMVPNSRLALVDLTIWFAAMQETQVINAFFPHQVHLGLTLPTLKDSLMVLYSVAMLVRTVQAPKPLRYQSCQLQILLLQQKNYCVNLSLL